MSPTRQRPVHSRTPPSPESTQGFIVPPPVWTAICFLLAYLLFLGKNRLLPLDEVMYAQAALAAARDGAWFPFSYEGKPFWEKPPLVLWWQGLSILLLGPTESAVRLGSALSAAGVLYLTQRLGETFSASRWIGFACAFFLGLQPHFILCARLGTMDMPLALCLMGTWWAIVKAQGSPERARSALTEAGAWTVLGVFIKSWFGLVLLPAAFLAFAGSRKNVRVFLGRLVLPAGVAVAAWILLYGAVYGGAFLEWELGRNLHDRLTLSALSSGSLDPGPSFHFYADLAQQGAARFWPLLPLALVLWAREALGLRGRALGPAMGLGWVFWATYSFLIVGSMVPLINYLLPLLPFGAVGLSFLLKWGRDQAPGWVGSLLVIAALNGPWVQGWMVAILALAAMALPWIQAPFPWVPRAVRILGLSSLGLLAMVQAQSYLRHPPDPCRVWVEAVLRHPAGAPSENLFFVGDHTEARVLRFYSRYQVVALDRFPSVRPPGALLFQQGPSAVFLPAPGGTR